MSSIVEEFRGKIPDSLLDEYEKESKNFKLTKAQEKEILGRIEQDYNNAIISPGEAIGVITAESFGEPSVQMSIAKDEKIIVKINNLIKAIEIGKLVDGFMSLKGSMKFNASEVLPLNDVELFVPSLNGDEKIEWKKVIECSRHKPNKNLIKLTTASGRKIIATDNHSFVIRKNNAIVPVKGSSLQIGDRIPVMNNFANEHILKDIKINENLAGINIIDGFASKPGRTKPIRNTIELDGLTGWFFGAYLSEGFANGYAMSISNNDDNYIANAKMFADRIGLAYSEDIHHRGFAESRDLNISSVLLSSFIVENCRKGSDFKKVPNFAYNAGNEFVSGLLRAYFDGDGNFSHKAGIRASSNSKELINGIALLLSRFKIFSFKMQDKKNQHWLFIPYKYAPLFLANIGSDIEEKRDNLCKLSEKAKKFWNIKSREYYDMVSGFENLFYDTAKKIGYPTRYVNNFTKRQKIGRTAVYRYIKIFEELSNKKNIDIKQELVLMRKMLDSDVIWDAITKIEQVDYNEYVYDLSVPGLETFTTFEGIITHNTLNIFHFAGVAELNVTLGLPRLIELFDARANIETPSMEIYLKKDYRNDEEAIKKIAALIKETKFNDIISQLSINVMKMQIEAVLNKKEMRELKINEKTIVENLAKKLKGCSIRESEDMITIKPASKESELREIYKIKEKVRDVYMRGIPGIKNVLPIKRASEYVILTVGSNLAEVLELKEIDETRTISNNVTEIQQVLGIEAARNAIINEAMKVIKDQGLDIDIRHFMLIADLMTVTGKIRGVTRSGITGEKESVLARASFETPIKHLINASIIGEIDNLNSVVENVMLNQPVPVGTGLPGLLAKMIKAK